MQKIMFNDRYGLTDAVVEAANEGNAEGCVVGISFIKEP